MDQRVVRDCRSWPVTPRKCERDVRVHHLVPALTWRPRRAKGQGRWGEGALLKPDVVVGVDSDLDALSTPQLDYTDRRRLAIPQTAGAQLNDPRAVGKHCIHRPSRHRGAELVSTSERPHVCRTRRRRGTPASSDRSAARAFASDARSTRRRGGPPTDAEIEAGLRQRAVTSARDAEVLLRWLDRPRVDTVEGVDLDALSTPQLERLHAGLVRIAALPERELQALLMSLLVENEDA